MKLNTIYDDLVCIEKTRLKELEFFKVKLLEVIRMWENHKTDYSVGDWNTWLEDTILEINKGEKK